MKKGAPRDRGRTRVWKTKQAIGRPGRAVGGGETSGLRGGPGPDGPKTENQRTKSDQGVGRQPGHHERADAASSGPEAHPRPALGRPTLVESLILAQDQRWRRA